MYCIMFLGRVDQKVKSFSDYLVDIVGTLCSIEGITAADIGIINVRDISTYVEILNNKGDLVYQALQKMTIKGRLRKVSKEIKE